MPTPSAGKHGHTAGREWGEVKTLGRNAKKRDKTPFLQKRNPRGKNASPEGPGANKKRGEGRGSGALKRILSPRQVLGGQKAMTRKMFTKNRTAVPTARKRVKKLGDANGGPGKPQTREKEAHNIKKKKREKKTRKNNTLLRVKKSGPRDAVRQHRESNRPEKDEGVEQSGGSLKKTHSASLGGKGKSNWPDRGNKGRTSNLNGGGPKKNSEEKKQRSRRAKNKNPAQT